MVAVLVYLMLEIVIFFFVGVGRRSRWFSSGSHMFVAVGSVGDWRRFHRRRWWSAVGSAGFGVSVVGVLVGRRRCAVLVGGRWLPSLVVVGRWWVILGDRWCSLRS